MSFDKEYYNILAQKKGFKDHNQYRRFNAYRHKDFNITIEEFLKIDNENQKKKEEWKSLSRKERDDILAQKKGFKDDNQYRRFNAYRRKKDSNITTEEFIRIDNKKHKGE